MIKIKDDVTIRAILRDQSFLPPDVAGVLTALGNNMDRDFKALASRTSSIPFFVTGSRHKDLRFDLAAFYRPKKLECWRPTIASRAASRIAALSGATKFCVVSDFSLPLLFDLAPDMLGIRPLEYHTAHTLFRDIEVLLEPLPRVSQVNRAQSSLETLCDHVLNSLSEHSDETLETLAGTLGKQLNSSDGLTHDSLCTLVAICFMTTVAIANTLHNILHNLLQNSDGLRPLADPTWIKKNLDNLMRLNTAQTVIVRRATADKRIGSYMFQSGDVVELMIADASRNLSTCPYNTKLLNPQRRHLVFGAGAHTCPGRYLTELILEEALVAIGHQLSDAKLAEPATELRTRQVKTFTSLFIKRPTMEQSL